MSEHLKHKMQTFEVAPPATAWEAIAVRLDDYSKHETLSRKLISYEVPPPENTWNKILAGLDNDSPKQAPVVQDVKVRTLTPRIKWYKLAAVAVITALLVGGAWFYVYQSGQQKQPSFVKDTSPARPDTKTTVTPEILSNNPGSNAKADDATIAAGDKNPIPAKPGQDNKVFAQSVTEGRFDDNDYVVSYTKVNRALSLLEQPIVITAPVLLDENGMPYRDINVLSNNRGYITIAGPNGQMTRVSAKFANVIQFINGSDDQVEENIDIILRESGFWKQRFQQWRTKISQSGYVPAPGNFLGIFELKDMIEEK